MTRFARARGSKSSNEKVPECATPWSELKKSMIPKENPRESVKELVSNLKSNFREKNSPKWAKLDDENYDPLNIFRSNLSNSSNAEINIRKEEKNCSVISNVDSKSVEKKISKRMQFSGQDDNPFNIFKSNLNKKCEIVNSDLKPSLFENNKIKLKRKGSEGQDSESSLLKPKKNCVDIDDANSQKCEMEMGKSVIKSISAGNHLEIRKDEPVKSKNTTCDTTISTVGQKKKEKKNPLTVNKNVVKYECINSVKKEKKMLEFSVPENESIKKKKKLIESPVVPEKEGESIKKKKMIESSAVPENEGRSIKKKKKLMESPVVPEKEGGSIKKKKKMIESPVVPENEGGSIKKKKKMIESPVVPENEGGSIKKKKKKMLESPVIPEKEGGSIKNKKKLMESREKEGEINISKKKMKDFTSKALKKSFSNDKTINISNKKVLKNHINNSETSVRKNSTSSISIGGEVVDLVKFKGFFIKKDDAERLKELKKKMVNEGIPKDQIESAIKLERRRCEKSLARMKKNVCFHCRKPGHSLSQCPEMVENVQTGTGICYKCGSTEHSAFACKVSEGKNYPFAECFICKEKGHIARECPDNPRGLYPNGGCCKLCSSVTHLKKDCPKRILENEEHTVRLGLRDDSNLEGLDDQEGKEKTVGNDKKKKKHVMF